MIKKQLLGKLTSQELLLNDDSLLDDLCNSVGVRASSEMGEEETGKIGVETLVSRDELVREGETRHETSLLKPEDGRERTREEDTLHGSKSNESLAETRFLVRDPSKSPVGLLSDTRNGVHSVKEEVSSSSVLNVSVDEERVGLGVNVLPIVALVRSPYQGKGADSHHDLEAVERLGLSNLDLARESLNKVLVDDTVRLSVESVQVRRVKKRTHLRQQRMQGRAQ